MRLVALQSETPIFFFWLRDVIFSKGESILRETFVGRSTINLIVVLEEMKKKRKKERKKRKGSILVVAFFPPMMSAHCNQNHGKFMFPGMV